MTIPAPRVKRRKKSRVWIFLPLILLALFALGLGGAISYSGQLIRIQDKYSKGLQECESNFQSLKLNCELLAKNYAKFKCCSMHAKYYYVDNWDVFCTNFSYPYAKEVEC